MKTKKSTLLSLATAAAIVATTFGTYAVWDTLKDTSTSNTITIASPSVKVKANDMNLDGTDVIGSENIVYEGTATFNITGIDKLADLKLTPTVAVEGKTLTAEAYSVEITQATDNTFAGDATNGYTDTTLETGENAYTVRVTVKDSSLADGKMTVSVEGVATPVAAE